jgi:hypothetical protein
MNNALHGREACPRAVDEHVYGDILELRSGVLDAFGIAIRQLRTDGQIRSRAHDWRR